MHIDNSHENGAAQGISIIMQQVEMNGKEVVQVYDEVMPSCKEDDRRYLGVGVAATL